MPNRTLRQRPSIFQKTDQGVPELRDVETLNQQSDETPKPKKVKVTFHLDPEDILAIDTIVSEEFRRTGHRPLRSEVVSRALRQLLEQPDR